MFYWPCLLSANKSPASETKKIIKSVVTRRVFRSQNSKNALAAGIRPNPAGGLTAYPDFRLD